MNTKMYNKFLIFVVFTILFLPKLCLAQGLDLSMSNGIIVGTVNQNTNSYQSLLNYHGRSFVDFKPATIKDDSWYFVFGIGLGMYSFNYDLDSIRVQDRIFSFSLESRLIKIFGDSYSSEFFSILTLGTDINTKYFHNLYSNNKIRSSNVISQYSEGIFGSDGSLQSINRFSPYISISFGPSNRFYFYAQYFFDNLYRSGIGAFESVNEIAGNRFSFGFTSFIIYNN